MQIEIELIYLVYIAVTALLGYNAWKQNENEKIVKEHGIYALWEIVSNMELAEIQAYLTPFVGGVAGKLTGDAPWYARHVGKMIDSAQKTAAVKAQAEANAMDAETAKKLLETDSEVAIE